MCVIDWLKNHELLIYLRDYSYVCVIWCIYPLYVDRDYIKILCSHAMLNMLNHWFISVLQSLEEKQRDIEDVKFKLYRISWNT